MLTCSSLPHDTGTAQAIILAVTKPFAAKFADVAGRAEAFVVSCLFYIVGFIIIAACKNIHTYAAGAIIYYVGYASLQILIQIVGLASRSRDTLFSPALIPPLPDSGHCRLHQPAMAWSRVLSDEHLVLH